MSAAPVKLPLKIYQGATFRKVVTWKAGDPAVPVDLTGCTARMHVRAKLEDAAPLLSLTTANGGIVLGDELGTVTIYLSDEATAAISWVSGVYDLEIEFTNGDVRRFLYGAVTVSKEVTRD